eukprot:6256282-Alexandrium_andersonii.AAC.1
MRARPRPGLRVSSDFAQGHREGCCGPSAQASPSPRAELDIVDYFFADPPDSAGILGLRRAAVGRTRRH